MHTSQEMGRGTHLRSLALQMVAANCKRLGAEIRIITVLHTLGPGDDPPSPCPLRYTRRRPLGELPFSNALAHLADPVAFTCHHAHARRSEWVVYAEPSCGLHTNT